MSLFRSSATLLSGSVAAQLIPLLALPIITRLYDPAALGLQALAVTWATAISVVALLRLDLAAVIPPTEDAARRYVHAALTAILVVIPIVALGFFLAGDAVLTLVGHPDARFWLVAVPVLALAMALSQLGSSLLLRDRNFVRMSTVNVVNQGATQVTGIIFGVAGAWVGGLVAAKVIGQTAAVATVLPRTLARYARGWRSSFRDLPRTVVDGRRFVLYNTPYSLLGTLARDAPLLVFGALASAASVGLYGLARLVTFVPVSLASASLSPVFFREAVDHLGTMRLETLARNLTRIAGTVTAAGFALVTVRGPELMEFAFGPGWLEAGTYAAVLAPAFWCALQASWIGRAFEVSGRQRRQLVVQLSSDAAVVAGTWGTLVLSGDLLLSVIVFATLTAAQAIIYYFIAAVAAGFVVHRLAGEWLHGAALFAMVALVLVFLLDAPLLPSWSLGISIALVLVVTAIVGAAVARTMRRRPMDGDADGK